MARGIVIPMRLLGADVVHWAMWDALCIDTTACGLHIREEQKAYEKADAVITCVLCASLTTRRA